MGCHLCVAAAGTVQSRGSLGQEAGGLGVSPRLGMPVSPVSPRPWPRVVLWTGRDGRFFDMFLRWRSSS